MRNWVWSMAAALLLAGCGSKEPEPEPNPNLVYTSRGLDFGDASPDLPPLMGPERRILAFGDSLFAGYGLNEGEGYPERLQAALRARGVNAAIANAGVSGDTSAAGLQRLAFVLDGQAEKPELVLLELGGNDLLRGLSPKETKANLAAMLDELKRRKLPVLLIGLRAPPNMGIDYQREFDAIYPALAKQYGVPLLPFFLEAVFDKPDLIQQDHIHPTAEGIGEIVAATADEVAEALPKP